MTMVYPTPGFVVRHTFLEFDPSLDGSSWSAQPNSCQRSRSDTTLYRYMRQPEPFGSDELRLYCQAREAREDRQTETSSSNGELPPDTQPSEGSDSQGSKLIHEEDRTTIMLEHLPSEYTRVLLAATLVCEGFEGTFEFLFVPLDLRSRSSNGYALIDFRSNADARRALAHFEGFKKWLVPSSEVCESSWHQYVQGMPDLLERYRNSPVMHHAVPELCKPAIFNELGEIQEFPKPTKRLRMPRLRGNGKAAKELHVESPSASGGGCSPSAQTGALVTNTVAPKTQASLAAKKERCSQNDACLEVEEGCGFAAGQWQRSLPRHRAGRRQARQHGRSFVVAPNTPVDGAAVPWSMDSQQDVPFGRQGALVACQQDMIPLATSAFAPCWMYVAIAC